MTIQSSPVQSYRDDFSFRNSPAAIRRFPFPFTEDSYLYSVNIEPATSRDPGSIYQHGFDIDEHYRSEMAERALVLDKDPRRYLVMPHMQVAAWDALQMLMEHLAADY
ncbi:MAG: heme-dependent oxidative N-demethylase subunit alpha family protein, partial [Pseudomonas sp.]